MNTIIKVVSVALFFTGAAVFVKFSIQAFEHSSNTLKVSLQEKQEKQSELEKKASAEAEEAYIQYQKTSRRGVKKTNTKNFAFDQPKHMVGQDGISTQDLASLNLGDFDDSFATQDSDVRLKLWKKRPKEFKNSNEGI